MKILLIFITLISLLNLTSSHHVSCGFTLCGGNVVSGYCCDVQGNFEITSPYNTIIQSVSTNHDSGKSNDYVTVFHAPYKNIQYFPTGIEGFYRNIRAIFLYGCHLKEIHRSDLKPFTELNEIYLSSNEIEILEEGLFEFNLNLISVKLNNNNIFHIHDNVFDNLSKLRYLLLNSNACINVNANNDRAAVQRLITQTKTQCQDSTFVSINNQVKSLKNESKFTSFDSFDQFRIKVENLDNQVESSKFSKFKGRTLINSLQYLKNIQRPMLDTCSILDSKFDEFSSNFSSMAVEAANIAKNSQNTCINETFAYIDKKLSLIDTQISTQSIEASLSKLDERVDEKFSVVTQKLSIFDDQAGLSEKIFSFGEKLVNFDEKLILFNDKFSFLDEKLSDFDEKLTNFGENTIDLINGQLQKMLIKKIEKIEKYLEEKFGKIE